MKAKARLRLVHSLQISLNPNPNPHRIPEWPEWILRSYYSTWVSLKMSLKTLISWNTILVWKNVPAVSSIQRENPSVAIVAILVHFSCDWRSGEECWGMWAKKVGFSWFSLLEPQKRYNLYNCIVFQFVVLQYKDAIVELLCFAAGSWRWAFVSIPVCQWSTLVRCKCVYSKKMYWYSQFQPYKLNVLLWVVSFFKLTGHIQQVIWTSQCFIHC